MISVVDANSNLKYSKLKLGTGLALQDPVLVSQGGLGITTCAQGDVFYGGSSVTKTYPTPSVVAPGTTVLLSNEAANLNLTGNYSNGTYGDTTGSGWIGYNGVTQITEAQAIFTPESFPSGTPIAYFATPTIAASLEALVSGIPIIVRLAKDAVGTKILMNSASGYLPAWTDPTLAAALYPLYSTRKSCFAQYASPSTTPFSNGWSITVDGNPANLNEYIGNWLRFVTSASSGTNSGIRPAQNWCWLDHNPTLKCILRLGPSLTGVRIWVIMANTSAAVSNSDDQHALKGVGLRYSDGAPDPGWVSWKSDGTTQTVSAGAVSAIAVNGVYAISVAVTGAGANFTVTINDSTSTIAIPSGALGTLVRFNIQITTTDGNSKQIDSLDSIYGEWD